MKKEFANVIVDISHEKVDRPFGYRIPERLADRVTPGVRVKIPFGAGNVLRTGYVLGAGIVELLARVLICAFIPQLLAGGAVSASAPLASFAAVCASDPGAWLTASLLLLFPLFRDILRRSRTRTLE